MWRGFSKRTILTYIHVFICTKTNARSDMWRVDTCRVRARICVMTHPCMDVCVVDRNTDIEVDRNTDIQSCEIRMIRVTYE